MITATAATIALGQRHAEELAHREQRRDEDHRPRRLGPMKVEQQQEERHRDDGDEKTLCEVAECQEAAS